MKRKHSHMKDVQEEAKTDMTPMIDAVFLLIIFFLCIDFKTLEAKLPAYLPKDRGSQNNPEEPIEQLSIKIVMDQWGVEHVRRRGKLTPPAVDPTTGRKNSVWLEGHVVHWEVGPVRYDDITKLKDSLTKIATDPSRRVPDKESGGTKVMPVVIEPAPGATYGDVALLVDVVSDSGFEEINFGGGLGERKQ